MEAFKPVSLGISVRSLVSTARRKNTWLANVASGNFLPKHSSIGSLVVKQKYTAAYNDIEKFLHEDQAMGVYLYGDLMVNEDARQQEIARRCFAAVRDKMDMSCVKVIGEMLF
ncbi:hypothetical protein XELAEV_18010169mg [Xenopus laevis]|uniref:Peptidase M1 leukotriene A4 hydrolase/aminopeptidase C-terminal domain-containing protein n=1 Tax=Xenopus laevis TaxID=8355 RepID=A0A974DVS8_XENLA|nr:hypothetical protein XELAEV_18010169mg [Xenopus laevis]